MRADALMALERHTTRQPAIITSDDLQSFVCNLVSGLGVSGSDVAILDKLDTDGSILEKQIKITRFPLVSVGLNQSKRGYEISIGEEPKPFTVNNLEEALYTVRSYFRCVYRSTP